MTPDEILTIDALSRCSFAPGTTQKRFVRQMSGRDRRRPLTDRQRAYLWAVAWSWRRQLPPDLVDLARQYSGGCGIRGRQINEERLRDAYRGASASPLPAPSVAEPADSPQYRLFA